MNWLPMVSNSVPCMIDRINKKLKIKSVEIFAVEILNHPRQIQLVKLLSLSSTDTFQLVKLFLSSSTYTIQLWSLDLKTSNVKHADVLFHTANKSTISLSKTII